MLKRAAEAVARGLAYVRESSDDTVLNFKPRLQLDGYSCGLQSLAAILDFFDYEVDLDELAADIGLTTDGCDEDQIRAAIRAYGLRHRTHHKMSMNGLRKCIDQDRPVLVALDGDRHWSVVYGFGDRSMYMMDPSPRKAFSFAGKRTLADFRGRWGRWGIEVFEPKTRRRQPAKPTPKGKLR